MDDRKKSSLTPWVVGLGLMLPLVYVLSIGPAVWLVDYFGIRHDLARLFYMPLIWLADVSSTVKRLLELYMLLWQ